MHSHRNCCPIDLSEYMFLYIYIYIYIYTRACIVRIRVQNSTSCAALSLIQGSSNSLFLMSDLDIASLHLFPTCLGAVLTKACSEKGIGFHRGCCWPCFWSWPRAPICHIYRSDRASYIFLVSFLNLAPSSNLGDINQIELQGCFWPRFSRRFRTCFMLRACFCPFFWCRF